MGSRKRERQPSNSNVNFNYWVITAIAVAAAIRVIAFSAAFPFFNNVDEQAHVDLVLKYARGQWPDSTETHFDQHSADLIVLSGSWEYLSTPAAIAPIFLKPKWTLPPEIQRLAIESKAPAWLAQVNHEALNPPLYYAIAALWYRVGAVFASGVSTLYFVRFLNAPIIAGTVVAAYFFCKQAFPTRNEMRYGVPLLIAFVPQDVFYSINCDVLPALVVSLWLVAFHKWLRTESPSILLSAMVGALAGSAMLIKFTNVYVLVGLAAQIVSKLWADAKRENGAPWSRAIVILAVTVLPVALLCLRNYLAFGDPSASAAKAQQVGMTPRPLSKVLEHPIFTLSGLVVFTDDLIRSFWRGEFFWYGRRLAGSFSDLFYTISTLAFFVTGGISWFAAWRASRKAPSVEPARTKDFNVWPLLLTVLGVAVAMLMGLSVSFEYEHSNAPSKEHPYFSNARYIIGAIVPFFVLYVHGLTLMLKRFAQRLSPIAVIIAICFFITISELMLSAGVFASTFNWFHL